MKRVDRIEGCDFDIIPDLEGGVLDGRWAVDIEALANSIFDADLERRVFRAKEGDHLFYLGRANYENKDMHFYVLIRNVIPTPKHIFFKKLNVDGKMVLRYSYMGEVEGRLGGMYVMMKEEAYREIS